jgi:hypothetical protein
MLLYVYTLSLKNIIIKESKIMYNFKKGLINLIKKLIKFGNSDGGVIIPKKILKIMKIDSKKDFVNISYDGEKVIIKKFDQKIS